MIKWLVIWIVINSWPVACDYGPLTGVDEYGREWVSAVQTLELCFETETTRMEKYFDTYEAAKAFVEAGEKSCEGRYNCDLQNFEILKIVREKIK